MKTKTRDAFSVRTKRVSATVDSAENVITVGHADLPEFDSLRKALAGCLQRTQEKDALFPRFKTLPCTDCEELDSN